MYLVWISIEFWKKFEFWKNFETLLRSVLWFCDNSDNFFFPLDCKFLKYPGNVFLLEFITDWRMQLRTEILFMWLRC
jgi:hypothetical protein